METTVIRKELSHEQIMLLTEREILTRLPAGTTKDDLFWMRLDGAKAYVEKKFMPGEWETIKKKTAFWNWWRTVWHMTDKKILARRDRMAMDMSVEMYTTIQSWENQKWYIPDNLIKMITAA